MIYRLLDGDSRADGSTPVTLMEVFGMSDESNNDEVKTFTQEQVNAFLADQKRKITERFADYDDVKAKASRLDEIEQASKSEAQKLQERLTALEAENRSFKQEKQIASWASEIVKGSDIPASVLRGSTREELEAHFQQLQSIVPKKQEKRTPKPAGSPSGEAGSRAVAALRQLGIGSN